MPKASDDVKGLAYERQVELRECQVELQLRQVELQLRQVELQQRQVELQQHYVEHKAFRLVVLVLTDFLKWTQKIESI